MQFFVAHGRQGKYVLALKFFATKQEYDTEAALYSRAPDVLECMPKVIDKVSNKDGGARDPFGNRMPPYIAMEKGVCLTTIVQSLRDVDNATIAKVMCLTSHNLCHVVAVC